MYDCVPFMCMQYGQRPEEGIDSLELELEMIVNLPVDSGNRTQQIVSTVGASLQLPNN